MIQSTSLKLYRGQVAEHSGLHTAMMKQSVEGAVYLALTGLDGDECADTRHHGGPERALHQYPREHYRFWAEQYGNGQLWQAPGMGENISSTGMTEDNVCLGDRYRWGEAVIEVSQPRSPCFKLSQRWRIKQFALQMQEISRCGWLYRVITPGLVSADQSLQLIERVADPMTIREVCDHFFTEPLNRQGLLRLQQQTRLSGSWSEKVEQRLVTGTLENWNFRLLGHA